MRSFRWLIVTGAVIIGLLIVAIAIGSIWLNSYIHSAAFKSDVEERATQSLGGPVQVQSIDFDVLHGVKLSGFVTQLDPAHAAGQGALKAQIASVDCTYSLVELLGMKLRLTGVTLDRPQIILTKQATTPMTVPASTDTASTPASGSAAATNSGSSMPFQFVLDRAKVNDGDVSILDASGASIVNLKGLNASADTSGYYDGRDVTGTLKVASVLAPNLTLRNFSTPFVYRANYIAANKIDATAFDGNLGGDFLLDGSAGPSTLNLNGKGFDMEQVMAQASPDSTTKLTGKLDLQSKWRGVETGDLRGEGDAQLSSGKLTGVRMLDEAAGLLKIKELNDPTITKAQTHFVVADRQAKFIGLQVDSPGFKLTGDGVVSFDGALDANLVLILGRDAMNRMPKEVSGSFVSQPDGSGSIAFHVTGTTSNPQTDLPQRLLMQNLQIKNVLHKALKNFFH